MNVVNRRREAHNNTVFNADGQMVPRVAQEFRR